jgi:hypothetical protein
MMKMREIAPGSAVDGQAWIELQRLAKEQATLLHRLTGGVMSCDLPARDRDRARIKEIENRRVELLHQMAADFPAPESATSSVENGR